MEVSFSPPNLKRIGYPKNTIYMKKQATDEIKRKILWKGTKEEAIKLGKITQEKIDEWDVNDEIEKAEIRGRKEGRW